MTRIQVIRFTQGGLVLYSGVMTVEQLLKHGIIDEWDPLRGWQTVAKDINERQ